MIEACEYCGMKFGAKHMARHVLDRHPSDRQLFRKMAQDVATIRMAVVTFVVLVVLGVIVSFVLASQSS